MIATVAPTPADARASVLAVLERRAGEPGALLPILHDVQDAIVHIPESVVPDIAAALNLSRAEVHGVISYYHHFRCTPAARHVIQICCAESCRALGAEALLMHAERHLGCAVHGRSMDDAFTLEPVYCLGLCASSPALMLDDEPHARMTPERFDALVIEARSQA